MLEVISPPAKDWGRRALDSLKLISKLVKEMEDRHGALHQSSAAAGGPTARCLLRGYLASNSDIVTRITKPVHIDDVGALSAQSDAPILFESIVEKPGSGCATCW